MIEEAFIVVVFNDDEFSVNDIKLLDYIVGFSRHKIAKDFVNITHAKDSLWRKSAIKYGIYDDLLHNRLKKTNYSIDFFMLFEDMPDSYIFEKYNSYLENFAFSENFKVLNRV